MVAARAARSALGGRPPPAASALRRFRSARYPSVLPGTSCALAATALRVDAAATGAAGGVKVGLRIVAHGRQPRRSHPPRFALALPTTHGHHYEAPGISPH